MMFDDQRYYFAGTQVHEESALVSDRLTPGLC
jgi:hypothetical protein